MVEESSRNNAQKVQASANNSVNGNQNNLKKVNFSKKTQVLESSSLYISTVADSANQRVINKVSSSIVIERMARLNDFEKQVFRMYRQGVQTAKIAYDLGVSRSTINRALQDIKVKLEINSANKNEILYKAHFEMGLKVSDNIKASLNDWIFRRRARANIQPTKKR